MSASVMDQLNLTPQERRIIVVIGVVVFLVLNLLLVWPHFKDLGQVRQQLEDTRATIEKENKEILQDIKPGTGYKAQLAQLQKQQGPIANQQVQLQRTVSDQAIKTGVSVDEIKPSATSQAHTNEFYEEQAVKIDFESQEAQLVNFLVNIGNDPAMIRVHELSLRTADANRYRLKGDCILSANYAKQTAITAPKAAAGAKTGPNSQPGAGTQSAQKNL
jgi:Tfp pilus assembly protein PilO